MKDLSRKRMAETLTAVEQTGKPTLRALRADNPSPMTHTGTMTYLLGRRDVVLIDPGPDLEPHRRAISERLDPGEQIVAILLTHSHADHVSGLGPLQDAHGAPSYGFGPPGAGRSAPMQALVEGGLPASGEGFDPRYRPDRQLSAGQVISPAGFEVEAVYTPGHTGCSLSFAVDDWLFTGDTVMGWATSLISPPDGDLTRYMRTLERLARRRWRAFYPGHGPPVTEPAARLSELRAHRRKRERQVLDALSAGLSQIPDIARSIYTETSPALLPAAERNVLAHLIDLVARGLAQADPAPLPDARFSPR